MGPKRADQDVVWVSNLNPDELVLVRRVKDPFVKPRFYYRLGRAHKGVYERVIVNRRNKSVAIDYMDTSFYFPQPYVAKRDLFYEGESPFSAPAAPTSGLNFVRHLFWVNKLRAYLAEGHLSLAKMKYNSLFA